MSDGYFITPADAPQVEMTTMTGVYRRTMGTTDEAMLCEFFLLRGAIVPEHQHMNDQVGYVVYGSVEVTINGVTQMCRAGDSYAVPGGVLHSLNALSDALTIDVFSPPRADYRTDAR